MSRQTDAHTETGAAAGPGWQVAIDASGREVLLGLTPEESAFVVDCCGQTADTLTALQSRRLAALVTRHERLRLRSMAAPADTPTKDETRQG